MGVWEGKTMLSNRKFDESKELDIDARKLDDTITI